LVDPSGWRSRTGALVSKFVVYGLYCITGQTIYIGQTSNLTRRMKEHLAGKVSYTKCRKPFKLIYIERVASRDDGVRREKLLKSRTDRRYLRNKLK